MERAEPAIIFIACSTEFALRSFILTSAIWRSCSCVTLPAPVPVTNPTVQLQKLLRAFADSFFELPAPQVIDPFQ